VQHKHINNLRTNRHNKAVYTRANTLLAQLTTWCFTLIYANKIKDGTPNNTIPSWLLTCACSLPRCKCLARFPPNILCILGALPTTKPPFTPNLNLQVQIFEFTNYNDRFPAKATPKTKSMRHSTPTPIPIRVTMLSITIMV
jgi:hypothetical protein